MKPRRHSFPLLLNFPPRHRHKSFLCSFFFFDFAVFVEVLLVFLDGMTRAFTAATAAAPPIAPMKYVATCSKESREQGLSTHPSTF